jgi:hypothetical protein
MALKKKFRKRCPYLMIQPTLANSKECKIILLDGKAKYISNPSRVAGGRKFAGDAGMMSCIHLQKWHCEN